MSQVVLGEDSPQFRKKWYFNNCLVVDLMNHKFSSVIFNFLQLEEMNML